MCVGACVCVWISECLRVRVWTSLCVRLRVPMQIVGYQILVLVIWSIATGKLGEYTLVCVLAVLTHFRLPTETKSA